MFCLLDESCYITEPVIIIPPLTKIAGMIILHVDQYDCFSLKASPLSVRWIKVWWEYLRFFENQIHWLLTILLWMIVSVYWISILLSCITLCLTFSSLCFTLNSDTYFKTGVHLYSSMHLSRTRECRRMHIGGSNPSIWAWSLPWLIDGFWSI